jgi:hypothetical protein
MSRLAEMTNATKAQIIAFVNAALVLILAFGVDISDQQQAAITGAVNALLALWVGVTYEMSHKRAEP